MSTNGFLRAVIAGSRRAERNSRRRQREYEQQLKVVSKIKEFEYARLAVDEYENRIQLLKSLHQECSEPINWHKVNLSPEPTKPVRNNINELNAIEELENYDPGFIDRLFKIDVKKRIELNHNIENAKQIDDKEFRIAVNNYKNDLQEWLELKELSTNIIGKDLKAFLRALEIVDPFSEIKEIGSLITFKMDDVESIEVDLFVNDTKIIPSQEKVLLKSGKLSIKEIPKAKYNEFYQDYVCSCVLRVAREVFALLPIKKVYISANANMLNPKTGYTEVQSLLSIFIPRETLDKLNFDLIDPSDSMSNFNHNMKFKKTSGFEPVTKIVQ